MIELLLQWHQRLTLIVAQPKGLEVLQIEHGHWKELYTIIHQVEDPQGRQVAQLGRNPDEVVGSQGKHGQGGATADLGGQALEEVVVRVETVELSQQAQRRRQVLQEVFRDDELLQAGHLADVVGQGVELVVVDFEGDDGAEVAYGIGQFVDFVGGEVNDGHVAPATDLRRHQLHRVHRAVKVVQLVELLDAFGDASDVVAVYPEFRQAGEVADDVWLEMRDVSKTLFVVKIGNLPYV